MSFEKPKPVQAPGNEMQTPSQLEGPGNDWFVTQRIKYALLGNLQDSETIISDFCSWTGEPFPATREERFAMIDRLKTPEMKEKIRQLDSKELRTPFEALNEMVTVTNESEELVLIHVSPVDIPTLKKSAMFKDGLRKLANLIQHDPKFSRVETIGALSWIVTEHPRILEHFGFTLGPINDIPEGQNMARKYAMRQKYAPGPVPKEHLETEMKFASMTRADFLARYGSVADAGEIEKIAA